MTPPPHSEKPFIFHHIALLLLSIFVIGFGSKVPATHEAFACGGADNTLTIYGTPPASSPLSHSNNDADNEGEAGHTGPRMLRSYGLSAPVLCLDSYGPYVACSLMDGGHAVVSIHSFIHSFIRTYMHSFIHSFLFSSLFPVHCVAPLCYVLHCNTLNCIAIRCSLSRFATERCTVLY